MLLSLDWLAGVRIDWLLCAASMRVNGQRCEQAQVRLRLSRYHFLSKLVEKNGKLLGLALLLLQRVIHLSGDIGREHAGVDV